MLTRRQGEYLDWIRYFIQQNSMAPSFEEIRVGLSLESRATVHKKIGELAARGVITYRHGFPRSIEIVGPKTTDCPSCLRLSRQLAAANQTIAELRAH